MSKQKISIAFILFSICICGLVLCLINLIIVIATVYIFNLPEQYINFMGFDSFLGVNTHNIKFNLIITFIFFILPIILVLTKSNLHKKFMW